MAGALLTLYNTMLAAPQLAGVTQHFGEEFLESNDPPPRIVWVPSSTVFEKPFGYAGDDLNVPRTIWQGRELIEAHIWALSTTPNAQPQDHADAVEALRKSIVQAVHGQMWSGYYYAAVRGQWVRGSDEITRFGRAYVLWFEVYDPVELEPEVEATITSMPNTPALVRPDGTLELNV